MIYKNYDEQESLPDLIAIGPPVSDKVIVVFVSP